jgi:phosphoribosylformimino-5-aminoimidazole carboxamide ribotide isomerase
MTQFTIFPAIDLRHGQVVRLQHGDPGRQTTFSADPPATARRWADAGAHWLHVINLDGAFEEGGAANWEVLPRLAEVGPRLQFGGGMRNLEDVQRALDAGAARVILGTLAVENPELLRRAISRFGPQKILVALDARDGLIRTRGWRATGGVSAVELARRVAADGVTTVVHTDIARDGVLTGVNAQASAALARETGLQAIASGGVASLKDVRRTMALAADGVVGLIAGRALYEGALDLSEALRLAQAAPDARTE